MRKDVVVLVRDDGRTGTRNSSASLASLRPDRQHLRPTCAPRIEDSHVRLAAHDGQERTEVSYSEAVREGEDAEPDDAEKGGTANKERTLASLVTEVSRDGGVDGSRGVRRGGEEERLLNVVSATLQNDREELSGGQVSSASASDELGIVMLT